MKRYNISFSEYSTYLQCPHKWYLNYCLGLPGDVSEELVFGQIMHKSIESILGNPHVRKPMFFQGLVKNHLKNELEKINDIDFLNRFNNSSLSFVFISQVVELLKVLDFFNRFGEYEIIAIEYKLEDLKIITIDDIEYCFKGFIDLVLKHKITGRYLLLDWKSSRKAWDIEKKQKDNEDLYTQLGLYKNFYSKKENIPFDQIDVKFFNIPREVPNEMQSYNGILNETYVEYLINKFETTCKKIHSHNLFELPKARFLTKKNFCSRCHYNTEELCNSYDEFQAIG